MSWLLLSFALPACGPVVETGGATGAAVAAAPASACRLPSHQASDRTTRRCQVCVESACLPEFQAAYGARWSADDLTGYGGTCGAAYAHFCACLDDPQDGAACVDDDDVRALYDACSAAAGAFGACERARCASSCGDVVMP